MQREFVEYYKSLALELQDQIDLDVNELTSERVLREKLLEV